MTQKLETKLDDTLLPSPKKPCISIKRSYLVEGNGDLFSVFEGPSGKYIEVFKLDRSSMSWQKVDSLEDEMLFVSCTTSLSARTQHKLHAAAMQLDMMLPARELAILSRAFYF